jgi:hypothetical protein
MSTFQTGELFLKCEILQRGASVAEDHPRIFHDAVQPTMQPQAMIAIQRVSEITGDTNPYRCRHLFIPQMYIPEGNHRVGLTVNITWPIMRGNGGVRV